MSDNPRGLCPQCRRLVTNDDYLDAGCTTFRCRTCGNITADLLPYDGTDLADPFGGIALAERDMT